MPTTYSDQFFEIDPFSPPGAGTAMTVTNLGLVDQDDDNDIEAAGGDTVGGFPVTASWPGDTVTIELADGTQITYTGITFYVDDGGVQREFFTPTDGQVLLDGSLVGATGVSSQGPLDVGDLGPPCFTRGTLIATPEGEKLIEDLRAGDMVLTLDHGPQALLMVRHKCFPATGRNAPVMIRKGALGNAKDLLVSQQHRMLITDWRAQMYFGVEQVLVAAKHLCNGDTIEIAPGEEVEYFHLLFDSHQIVWAAGIPSESYFPGHAVNQADRETREEIDRLFPDLAVAARDHWVTVRPVARQFEAALLN